MAREGIQQTRGAPLNAGVVRGARGRACQRRQTRYMGGAAPVGRDIAADGDSTQHFTVRSSRGRGGPDQQVPRSVQGAVGNLDVVDGPILAQRADNRQRFHWERGRLSREQERGGRGPGVRRRHQVSRLAKSSLVDGTAIRDAQIRVTGDEHLRRMLNRRQPACLVGFSAHVRALQLFVASRQLDGVRGLSREQPRIVHRLRAETLGIERLAQDQGADGLPGGCQQREDQERRGGQQEGELRMGARRGARAHRSRLAAGADRLDDAELRVDQGQAQRRARHAKPARASGGGRTQDGEARVRRIWRCRAGRARTGGMRTGRVLGGDGGGQRREVRGSTSQRTTSATPNTAWASRQTVSRISARSRPRATASPSRVNAPSKSRLALARAGADGGTSVPRAAHAPPRA